jgi:hypothetical protein
MEEKYDFMHIVSLGYNCEIANSIIEMRARDSAYPFDWNFSRMWKINETMKQRFSNFFLQENLMIAKYKKFPAKERDNGFIYIHDGPYHILSEYKDEYTTVKEKYNRRIIRLLDLLDNGKSILFVRSFYDDKIDDHLEFVNILKNIYPNSKFHLLVFCKDEKKISVENDNIEYINGVSIDRFSICNFLKKKYKLPVYTYFKKEY